MGAVEADQLCRSIPGHEMSRLHLDGILIQSHLRRRRVAGASLPMTAVEIVTVVVNRDDRSLLEESHEGTCRMISESLRVYSGVTSSNIHWNVLISLRLLTNR